MKTKSSRTENQREKNPAAVALGRLGGKTTGRKGLAAMSPQQRAKISALGVKRRALNKKNVARTAAGESIIRGVKQAIAWAAGEDVSARRHVVQVPHVDVGEVRRRMGMSQDEFANRFGFAPASVRNWEQGRRQPEGPARVLLAVIDQHPGAVESVLVKLAGA